MMLVGIICSFIVGSGALVVSACTLWITFTARTAQYRNRLYEEQLKLYPELIALMDVAVINALTYRQVCKEQEESAKEGLEREYDREKFFSDAHEGYRKLNDCFKKACHLLPDEVCRATGGVVASVLCLVFPVFIEDDKEQLKKLRLGIAEQQEAVVRAMRHCVGADNLTGETLKLFGSQAVMDQKTTGTVSSGPGEGYG
jgi:hypothetical protein